MNCVPLNPLSSIIHTQILLTDLHIFPNRISWEKSSEIHKNMKKTAKFGRNLIKYMLVQLFEPYFSYWGYLIAVNLQIYRRTSSLKRANNIPKLPGIDYVVKNCWAPTSVRITLKTMVWSVQNRSIYSEICLENNHKIGSFLPTALWWSLARTFPRNQPIFPWICA